MVPNSQDENAILRFQDKRRVARNYVLRDRAFCRFPDEQEWEARQL